MTLRDSVNRLTAGNSLTIRVTGSNSNLIVNSLPSAIASHLIKQWNSVLLWPNLSNSTYQFFLKGMGKNLFLKTKQ
jgi:hypothetical protein